MRARKFRLKFFMTNKQTHVIVISFFIGILNIVSISLKAQGCIDVTPLYIQNAGFDEDLTWNADGSKKGEIVGTPVVHLKLPMVSRLASRVGRWRPTVTSLAVSGLILVLFPTLWEMRPFL